MAFAAISKIFLVQISAGGRISQEFFLEIIEKIVGQISGGLSKEFL